MSELKHGFGAAKMNKDADERTVPNGEYRDALNVQIVTSDGSDVGTLQTLLGNSKISSSRFQATLSSQAKCVGSVADEANNKIYYFVSDDVNYTDYVLRYDLNSADIIPIIVDKWRVEVNASTDTTTGIGNVKTYFTIDDLQSGIFNITNIRPGMRVTQPDIPISSSAGVFVYRMKNDNNGNWRVYLDIDLPPSLATSTSTLHVDGFSTTQGYVFTCIADRVLNFSYFDSNNNLITSLITGIDIIDEVIYWTDGITEPKKVDINNYIKESITDPKRGTDVSGEYHSFFNVYDKNENLVEYMSGLGNTLGTQPSPLKEENLTVITHSPKYPPNLLMSNTSDGRYKPNGQASVLRGSTSISFVGFDEDNFPSGTILDVTFNNGVDYKKGDIIVFKKEAGTDLETEIILSSYEVQAELLSDVPSPTGPFVAKVRITFMSSFSLGDVGVNYDFAVMLQQEKPLYEFKFPRFAYRYKFKNNQYSSYSPFSEPAFMPGGFNYVPKEGYNLGMVNNLRSVYIMDFVPIGSALPKDVISIDILYKESNTNNVYKVRTVDRTDVEWEEHGSVITTDAYINPAGPGENRKGKIQITSEMVRSSVASNQLLRPWDNVPKSTKAQTIMGNRIVYANYKQNYNL